MKQMENRIMSIGNRIKELRAAKNLSQPDLAELIGIEQSYLSKLENDKSIPSNDIFRALLNALETDLDTFLSSLDMTIGQQKLMQIPDIENWLQQKQQRQRKDLRQYLYTCSFLIVLGICVFYAGQSRELFSDTQFEYESQGIILDGEPDHIFSSWRELIDPRDRDQFMTKRIEMEMRRKPVTILLPESKGTSFVETFEDGKRLFSYQKQFTTPRPVNTWLKIIGIFLFGMGLMGFILERKLFKY